MTDPRNGASDVNPMHTISLRAAGGTITSIALTNPSGKRVTGTMSAQHTKWTASEPLGYDKTYTWSGITISSDRGVRSTITGHFATVAPADTVGAEFFNEQSVKDEGIVGIGTPIVLQIYGTVASAYRADVEKHLRVVSYPPQQGSWAWEGTNDHGDVLHYRTKHYWKPGTRITINAQLYGVPYDGNGAYGAESLSWHLKIGREQTTYGNIATHRIRVTQHSKALANFPTSFGMDSVPARRTPVGNYVTMGKYLKYEMRSQRWHYDEWVPWATRISNNGVFLHGMPSTVDVQGIKNVSHGCANLSPEAAHWFYDHSLWGDPVIISNPKADSHWPPNGPEQGDIWDWTLSWTHWQALSARH